MTIQDSIYASIWSGKNYSVDLLEQIVSMENAGEDVCECKNKLILLDRWIIILEDYLANNFDANGNITSEFESLTIDQIEQIMSGIKEMTCNNKYPLSHFWILDRGYWDDLAYWRDTSVWYDEIPLV